MKKGLYLLFILFVFSVRDSFSQETEFYQFKYLRLGNGLCSKCNFITKKLGGIKDKYKPILIISSSESKYLNNILEFNGLLNYPKQKIEINNELSEKLIVSDFPILFYSNVKDSFNKLVLNIGSDFNSIKMILGGYNETKSWFDSSFYLPPFTEYYFENNTILISDDYTKSITFFNSQNKKTIIKLTNPFKRKVFQKLSNDSNEFKLLIQKGNKAIQYGADNSFFGSAFNHEDTLFILTYISVVNSIGNRLKSSQIQILVKIFNNEILDCFYIKYDPKKHITYDESGEHSMIAKNDSLYLIASHYNFFNKLKKGNHLTLFTLKGKNYIPQKNYNLQIPNDLLKSSNDTLDRTNGQFFNFNDIDYFYISSPNIYINSKNKAFKSRLFSNPVDYRYKSKNISFYKKNDCFTSLIFMTNTNETYIRYGTLENEVLLPIILENFNYNAKITANKIIYISSEGFYIEKGIIPAD